jgi:cell division protein FtsB
MGVMPMRLPLAALVLIVVAVQSVLLGLAWSRFGEEKAVLRRELAETKEVSAQLRRELAETKEESARLQAEVKHLSSGVVRQAAAVKQREDAGELSNASFCPPAARDTTFWRTHHRAMAFKPGGYGHATLRQRFQFDFTKDAAQSALVAHPLWWCDKLASPVSAATLPTSSNAPPLTHADVAVAVVSGAEMYMTRAATVRDTWLMRFPNSMLFGQQAHPSLPAVDLARFYPVSNERLGEVFMWAPKHLSTAFPHAKWYYCGLGDDVFVEDEQLLRLLDRYAHLTDTEHVLHFGWNARPNMAELNATILARFRREFDFGEKEALGEAPGMLGVIMTRPAVLRFSAALERFRSLFGEKRFTGAPDRDASLLIQFLRIPRTDLGLTQHGTSQVFSSHAVDSSFDARSRIGEQLVALHYVSPMRMISLHQLANHRRLERLRNNPGAVQTFARQLIDELAQVTRRKTLDTRWLLETGVFPPCKDCWGFVDRFWDIPKPGARNVTASSASVFGRRLEELNALFPRRYGPQ